MNTYFHTSSKNSFFRENRLVFNNSPEKDSQSQEREVESPEGLLHQLSEDSLESYILKNPKTQERFVSYEEQTGISLRARAMNNLVEKLKEYIDSKEGIQNVSQELAADIGCAMAETVCRVLEMEIQVNTDPLTGLPDRRAFRRHLDEEIMKNKKLSLLIFDLDQFKEVNDTYGHPAGDAILRQLADRLCVEIRGSDLVSIARWGSGDEFVFLLNVPIEEALMIAKRISNLIKETPFSIGEESITLTGSIGASEYTGLDEDPHGDEMIKDADNNLYILKGKRPDHKGVIAPRRGQIACKGRAIPADEVGKSPDSEEESCIIAGGRKKVAALV